MSPPLVTVVIPSYNHANFIKNCIQSIVDQSYQNIELIIIDDGSSDGSIAVIQEMIHMCQGRFYRFEFRARGNKGLCATLNEALEWAQGSYFSPFASDDVACNHKIDFLVQKIIKNDLRAVFGKTADIDGNILPRSLKKVVRHSFRELLHHQRMPASPTALIKTSCIRSVGGYAEDVKLEDWYLWLKLTEDGAVLMTYPEVLAFYRRHNSNITNDKYFIQRERRIVIDKFTESSYYKKALISLHLVAARDYEASDKKMAIFHLKKYGLFRVRAISTWVKIFRK